MGLCPMTPEEFAAYRADYQWLKQAPRTEETERDLDVFQAQFAFCDIEDAINQAQGLLRTMLGSDGQVLATVSRDDGLAESGHHHADPGA